jgi:hypothetical protein
MTKPTASGTLGILYCSTLLALMFSIKFDPRTDRWNVFMGHMTYAMFQCRYEAEVLAETLTAQENLFPEAFYYLHLQSLGFCKQLVERATSMGERVRTVALYHLRQASASGRM